MGAYKEPKETCGTICLKYLLFAFNFMFWLAGGVVMAVGVWTLIEKTDYISLLPSMTYAASAYILVLAGVIVMVTGVLGCCATFKEHKRLLRVNGPQPASVQQTASVVSKWKEEVRELSQETWAAMFQKQKLGRLVQEKDKPSPFQ
ncbi:CD151 antigen GP27 [Takifugu flavidus]|uniref:CD151 antigen GP27 n=1 Tax=Takifugu flavidus TaxID=433684 RepID=A0A5C6NM39_9TELE|nr:CD151 antigen GP27 [Takifugu flavidus]